MTNPKNPRALILRSRLRAETMAPHQALHRHRSFVDLFEGTIDQADYRTLMQHKFGFYQEIDAAIDRALNAQDDEGTTFEYVRRSDLLFQDLGSLGAGPTDTRPKQLANNAFDFIDQASVAGVLYVIEGATLGGAQLDRAAQKILGQTGDAGRHYWAWCRKNGKSRWQLLMTYLAQQDQDDLSHDRYVAAAMKTFEMLGQWLEPLDRAAAHSHQPAL